MKFCSKCDMLFNLVIDTQNNKQQLKNVCKNCGNEELNDNICIAKISNEDNVLSITDEKLLKNICEDITLPRTKKINCPNNDCSSNELNSQNNSELFLLI